MKVPRTCLSHIPLWAALWASVALCDPVITEFDGGRLVWSNSLDTGYHSVEWASSLNGTGGWYKTWQFLKDIPAVPGETAVEVPMFYRVLWSSNASTSAPPANPPPDVTGFTATPGDGRIGLLWTLPVASNLAGVRVVKNDVWYPDDPADGTVIFGGMGTSVLDLNVVDGTPYYYKAFTYGTPSNFSAGVTASATPLDNSAPPTSATSRQRRGIIRCPSSGRTLRTRTLRA